VIKNPWNVRHFGEQSTHFLFAQAKGARAETASMRVWRALALPVSVREQYEDAAALVKIILSLRFICVALFSFEIEKAAGRPNGCAPFSLATVAEGLWNRITEKK
jgi:hypothetical protein